MWIDRRTDHVYLAEAEHVGDVGNIRHVRQFGKLRNVGGEFGVVGYVLRDVFGYIFGYVLRHILGYVLGYVLRHILRHILGYVFGYVLRHILGYVL
ncbi:hypothetical protein, partial [Burkholderia ubonensis]